MRARRRHVCRSVIAAHAEHVKATRSVAVLHASDAAKSERLLRYASDARWRGDKRKAISAAECRGASRQTCYRRRTKFKSLLPRQPNQNAGISAVYAKNQAQRAYGGRRYSCSAGVCAPCRGSRRGRLSRNVGKAVGAQSSVKAEGTSVESSMHVGSLKNACCRRHASPPAIAVSAYPSCCPRRLQKSYRG